MVDTCCGRKDNTINRSIISSIIVIRYEVISLPFGAGVAEEVDSVD